MRTTRKSIEVKPCAVHTSRNNITSRGPAAISGDLSNLRHRHHKPDHSTDDGITEPLSASRSESFREFLNCHARSLGKHLHLTTISGGVEASSSHSSSLRSYIAPAPRSERGSTSPTGHVRRRGPRASNRIFRNKDDFVRRRLQAMEAEIRSLEAEQRDRERLSMERRIEGERRQEMERRIEEERRLECAANFRCMEMAIRNLPNLRACQLPSFLMRWTDFALIDGILHRYGYQSMRRTNMI